MSESELSILDNLPNGRIEGVRSGYFAEGKNSSEIAENLLKRHLIKKEIIFSDQFEEEASAIGLNIEFIRSLYVDENGNEIPPLVGFAEQPGIISTITALEGHTDPIEATRRIIESSHEIADCFKEKGYDAIAAYIFSGSYEASSGISNSSFFSLASINGKPELKRGKILGKESNCSFDDLFFEKNQIVNLYKQIDDFIT